MYLTIKPELKKRINIKDYINKGTSIFYKIKNEDKIKILSEANYQNDLEYKNQAEQYIEKIQGLLNNYPNGLTEYNTDKLSVSINLLDDLEIVFLDLDSKFNKNTSSGDITRLINNRYVIYIYNCYIELKDKGIFISYKKDTLFHELIHYLDFKRSKGEINVKKYNDEEYVNNSLELNSFFQEYFRKFNKQGKTFEEYIKNFINTKISNIPYKEMIWVNLTPENKKRIIKRLYNSYKENNFN